MKRRATPDETAAYRASWPEGIPYGECWCGCGGRTNIAQGSRTTKGPPAINGEPQRYLQGHQHRKSPLDYVVDQATECWIWQRAMSNGYPVVSRDGRCLPARVWIYEKRIAPVEPDKRLDWACGEKRCVNPDHLLIRAKDAPRIFVAEPNPSGLCQCGCGQRTKPARVTSTEKGWVKGKPKRYLTGHNGRVRECIYQNINSAYSVDPQTGCWNWKRARSAGGYGHLVDSTGRQVIAHRFMYELHRGPVSAEQHLHHHCRNTACINPDHLEPLSVEEHMRLHGREGGRVPRPATDSGSLQVKS